MNFDCPVCNKGDMCRWSGSDYEECNNCHYKIPKPK